MLPAPVKLFSLLVDTVGEQQEGGGPGYNGRQAVDDEDDEWEDASDGGLHSDLGSLGPGEYHPPAFFGSCDQSALVWYWQQGNKLHDSLHFASSKVDPICTFAALNEQHGFQETLARMLTGHLE